jgi:hypothetical protein
VIDEWILEPTTTALPEQWTLKFVIGYGEDETLLGTAPGGENLTLGPDFGAQAPDGTWWFLDGAKRRLAHYDSAGIYLDAVETPIDYLVDGTYFQFQLPRVLADGTLVATRFDGEATEFLTVSGGNPSRVFVPGTLLPRADDGSTIYGFDLENALWAIDPVTADREPVEWFVSQAGSRYRIGTTVEGVLIELPDIGVERMIPLKAGIGPGAVHASVEVASGADGVIHLLFLGISASDETTQLGGYTTITDDGRPTAMEPILDPFTPADPGSPSHLGVTYGSVTPWFMMIGEQGVEVYVRR